MTPGRYDFIEEVHMENEWTRQLDAANVRIKELEGKLGEAKELLGLLSVFDTPIIYQKEVSDWLSRAKEVSHD